MLTRQDIYDLYEQGPEAIANVIEPLLKQNEQLTQRVKDLEERLNKNSRNSDKPPSSDGLKKRTKKPKPKRDKKKRNPGGQIGHRGTTLKMSDKVDAVVRHEISHCPCGQSLAEIDGEIGRKKQVWDIPTPKIIKTEHQAVIKNCPCCGKANSGKIPEEIKGNVQYGFGLRALVNYLMVYQLLPYERTAGLLETIYGVSPSQGTLHRMLQDGYDQLETAETKVRQAIANADVIHCDETGHRVGTKTCWVHVASTKEMTFYLLFA